MIEPLLLTTARVTTFIDAVLLTGASGFFFSREQRLFLVTSRHVLLDDATGHHPNRIEIELHTDAENLTQQVQLSAPLYREGQRLWRQGQDAGGDIDVAVLELDRTALPEALAIRSFTPAHLQSALEAVEVGDSLLIVGFPLGFHDTLHHLPVARQAVIASSFGLRFQGQGYFLTDGRTHRGTSGAPVVMRGAQTRDDLNWTLLGVALERNGIGEGKRQDDEALRMNKKWYADILLTLTEDPEDTGAAHEDEAKAPSERA